MDDRSNPASGALSKAKYSAEHCTHIENSLLVPLQQVGNLVILRLNAGALLKHFLLQSLILLHRIIIKCQ